MGKEYMPTTGEVRDAYADRIDSLGGGPVLGMRQFDRWLAAHDRQVKARALREFASELPGLGRGGYAQMAERAADRIEREAD